MAKGLSTSDSLEEFCQSHSSFKTKIALLSFYKVNFSKWTDKLLLVLEYLQLMSQIILSQDDSTTNYDLPFQIIIYFFKLINPSYLLGFDREHSAAFAVLILILCCVILKLMLFAYVVCVSLGHTKKFSWLIDLWRWVFKLQTRLIYFLFTSFYLRAMVLSLEGSASTPIGKTAIMCITCFVIVIEFVFSLMLETQMGYFLPDKSFLASKNNGLQIITLTQKLVIQMILAIFRSDLEKTRAWVISCFSMAFNLLRTSYYYRFLPLYHFKALTLQGSLLWVVICLNVAHFAENIRRSIDDNEAGMNFMITIWIILALLAYKMSYEGLRMVMMKILCTNTSYSNSPEVLIHKMIATGELKKNGFQSTQFSDKYHITQLVSQHQEIKFAEILGVEIGTEISKEMRRKIDLLYCQDLARRFPKSDFVKMHLAKIYFKSPEPHYAAIIKIISELTRNKWSEYYSTASLLLCDVENSILSSQSDGEEEDDQKQLDLFTFLKNKLLVGKLKKQVLAETELYMNVSKNILSDVSDIGEIYNLAQLIGESKRIVQKTANKLFKNLPESYVSPYLIYARYHLILNYSLLKFDKYMESFAQKYYRNEQYFKASKLIQENLYQDSNGFLLLSSQESESGKILFCTKTFQNLCGGECSRYIGTKICNLFPSSLRAYYDELFKSRSKRLLNGLHRGYVFHRNKHLIEVDFCLKYHPYLQQNLCYNMIIRPVPEAEVREFLLVREDGMIEGASKEISKLLKLNEVTNNRLSINIKWLSKDLDRLHQKGLEIMRKKRSQLGTAEIYSNFPDNERRVQISPCETEVSKSTRYENDAFEFYCNFEPVSEGEVFMTLIVLEKVNKAHATVGENDCPITDEASENIIINERETNNEPPEPSTSYRKHLYSPARETLLSPKTNNTQGEMPLISSPTEKRHFLFETYQEDLASSSRRFDIDPLSDPRATNGDGKTQMNHFYKKDKIDKYLSSHSSRQNSQAEKATYKAFKAALDTKSYPKPFMVLCVIFYAVIISTFVSQILLKVVCDKTLDDLKVKKNLLKAAQERSYRGMLSQVNSLSAAFQISGLIATEGVLLNPTYTANTLAGHAVLLKEANKNMLEYAYTLNEEIQERLFTPNVRMYGTYLNGNDSDYEELTTFQATERIINAIETFALNAQKDLNTTGFNTLYYVTRNVLDYYQYENTQIVEMLTNSVLEEKQSYENITIACLTLIPILLVGIGLLLISIVIKQYQLEKELMKALIRVRSSGMKDISDRIRRFQKSLTSEEDFGTDWFETVNEDLDVVISLQSGQATSGYSKQHDTRLVKYETFRKRYYQYIVRVVLYLSFLVAVNIWDWVSTTSGNKVIYHRMDELQYAQFIGNRVTVIYTSFTLLFYTNNTLKVELKSALDFALDGVEEVKVINNQMYERFKEIDGSYNPEVKRIIYENNPSCSGFIGISLVQCGNLVKVGQATNMMALGTLFESMMGSKIQDYLSIRNSTSLTEIVDVSYINLPLLLPSFVLITFEAQLIVEIIDKNLEVNMQDTKNNRSYILVVFSWFLVVVSVLFWIRILKKIREVYNDFKKVLQIFPPGLTLSSYLLKKFVISTSNQSNLL